MAVPVGRGSCDCSGINVFVFFRAGAAKSANETAGATLEVVYLDSNPAEKRIIEYIGKEIAPDYAVEVAAVGLGDSTQINSAIDDGRYAGTIFQHRHWLKQVLDANPSTARRRRFPMARACPCSPTRPTTPRESGIWRRPA